MVEVETLLLFGDSHYDSGSFDHGTEEQKEALAYYEEAFQLLMKIEFRPLKDVEYFLRSPEDILSQ